MNKLVLKTILSIVFIGALPSVSFSGGASSAANLVKVQSIVGGGAALAYSASNFRRCSWSRRPHRCINGFKGLKQALDFFKSAKGAHGTAIHLGNGGDGSIPFDPNDAGFCFDPSSGCTPGAIDGALDGFQDPFKTGVGYENAITQAEEDILSKVKDLEKEQGVKIDLDAGTVTDKNGKTTSFADTDVKFPTSLSKSASGKMSGVEKALAMSKAGAGSSKRNLASSAGYGSSGSSSKKAGAGLGAVGGLGSLGSLGGGFGLGADGLNKKEDESKKKFLASLGDKDAGQNGVGFAGDNIFSMVQRRYTKKVQGKEFLDK